MTSWGKKRHSGYNIICFVTFVGLFVRVIIISSIGDHLYVSNVRQYIKSVSECDRSLHNAQSWN